jgi:hypothetical protein
LPRLESLQPPIIKKPLPNDQELQERIMFLPPQYVWFEPVLIASVVVFIVDLIGNSITFSSRYFSALVSAIVFAIIFGALTYSGLGRVSMSVRTPTGVSSP